MPETLFFKEGKISFLSILDWDGCLSIDTKMKLDNTVLIRSKIQDAVRERKKDFEQDGRYKAIQSWQNGI